MDVASQVKTKKSVMNCSWVGIIRNSKRKFKIPETSIQACKGPKAISKHCQRTILIPRKRDSSSCYGAMGGIPLFKWGKSLAFSYNNIKKTIGIILVLHLVLPLNEGPSCHYNNFYMFFISFLGVPKKWDRYLWHIWCCDMKGEQIWSKIKYGLEELCQTFWSWW